MVEKIEKLNNAYKGQIHHQGKSANDATSKAEQRPSESPQTSEFDPSKDDENAVTTTGALRTVAELKKEIENREASKDSESQNGAYKKGSKSANSTKNEGDDRHGQSFETQTDTSFTAKTNQQSSTKSNTSHDDALSQEGTSTSVISTGPDPSDEIFVFNDFKDKAYDASEKQYGSDFNFKEIENYKASTQDPRKLENENLIAYLSKIGLKQTSGSGQTSSVSKENGASLHEDHKYPYQGESDAQHNTRCMLSMIDMVKFELTRGDEMSFTGDPAMVAAGVLFTQKINKMEGSKFEISIGEPSGNLLNFEGMTQEIIDQAKEIIDNITDDVLINESFFEKVSDYQKSLKDPEVPTPDAPAALARR